MADYCPASRSNYFKVKDPATFEVFCKKWNLEMIRGGENDDLFGFLVGDEGGIPSDYYDEEKDEFVEGGFLTELASHLVEGWVAILREIGYEKMRYLVGYTVAVNSRSEIIELSLNRIYEDAKRLGDHITLCEY